MYSVTSLPLLNRTRAIFRRPLLGFVGVIGLTWRHPPRFCGLAARSLTLLIRAKLRRGFLINWLIVGIVARSSSSSCWLLPVDRRTASACSSEGGEVY